MNLNILLVDAEIEDESIFVHRFMFGSVHDALRFISQPIIKKAQFLFFLDAVKMRGTMKYRI